MTNEKIQELADCLSSKSVELNEDELEQVSGGVTIGGGCIRSLPFKPIIYKPTPTFPVPTLDDLIISF
ncbi:MAG: hypothetical protein K2G36_04495 [Ruminococcus sp.]|nr:hypothetical protein [Ruminococcus sp.]